MGDLALTVVTQKLVLTVALALALGLALAVALALPQGGSDGANWRFI